MRVIVYLEDLGETDSTDIAAPKSFLPTTMGIKDFSSKGNSSEEKENNPEY
jgi:hypothetical protein